MHGISFETQVPVSKEIPIFRFPTFKLPPPSTAPGGELHHEIGIDCEPQLMGTEQEPC